MRFFFPDSQDFVDGSFDFVTEGRSENRTRQRDDLYPHHVFRQPPYDGLLVSKAVVDGVGGGTGKYSAAQRRRFLCVGVREYFRIQDPGLRVMGDCGAFTYVREEKPPFTAEAVAGFYADCGFDYGLSVDHVILGFKAEYDTHLHGLDLVPKEWRARQELTLRLAEDFLHVHRAREYGFTPIGVAQGWSPDSYAHAVAELQKMGYHYIALGGMVPLKTKEILLTMERVSEERQKDTSFHLLGITRCENVAKFQSYGAVSFDSTSPLRKAFKDDLHNYYAPTRTYSAVRVPQVDKNPKLLRRIVAGLVNQSEACRLERDCLLSLAKYDRGETTLDAVLERLRAYELVHDCSGDRTDRYREVLADQPWKKCPCEVCRSIGIHVVIFRGAERNRRRGFHNLYVFYNALVRGRRPAQTADWSTEL
jgi:hypothetical protein